MNMWDNIEPLIVCGGPRCGTRFVANVINQHENISLQSEIPAPAMQLALDYVRNIDGYFSGEKAAKWGGAWSRKRKEMVYFAWLSLQKGRERPVGPKVRWYGNKTPNHEAFWRDYEEIFGAGAVRYVFCIRNFRDHFLSMKALNPKNTIERVASKYRNCCKDYSDMKAAIDGRVSLFVLDDLRQGGPDYLRKVLFENIGIPFDNRIVLDLERRDNSSDSHGLVKPKSLNDEELAFMARNADLDTLVDDIKKLSA